MNKFLLLALCIVLQNSGKSQGKVICNNLPVISVKSEKYSVKRGETIRLTAMPQGTVTYVWTARNTFNNNSVFNPTSVVNVSSWYKVLVTDIYGCTNRDSVFIGVLNDSIAATCSGKPLYAPSFFSATNDGSYSFFKIEGFENTVLKDFNMVIYNRWGEKVFESSNPLQYWDGSANGRVLSTGIYIYTVHFICEDGRKIFCKGNVTLLR